ncbi:MAG: hypothetical protein LBV19_08875 [Streptococcaceae bacterium]|jgi:ATP-dependent protease HslVU (ClpYQ) peptidase subunit|nr:hypothetical protein [Streptococcaceae bacterium]
MTVIFSLVLEFFLLEQLNNAKDLKAEKQYMTAQIMYTIAKQRNASFIRFDKGEVTAENDKVYAVKFPDGKIYTFGD